MSTVFPNPPQVKGLTWTIMRTFEFATTVQSAPNLYTTRIAQTRNPVWHWLLIYDYIYDGWLSPNNTRPNNPYTDFDTLLGFLLNVQGRFASFLYNDTQKPDNYVGPGVLTTGWAALTKYWIGASILDSANHWQQVTTVTTGISGATTPTFNHSGSTTTDGGVTWTDRGSGYSGGVPNNGGGYVAGAIVQPAVLQVVNDGAGNYYSPVQRNMGGQFYEDITDLNPASTITVYAGGTNASGSYTLGGPGLAIPGYSFLGLYLAWNAPAGGWAATHAYSLGNQILDPAGHIQQVTTAGTAGAAAPAWNDSGGTTADGTGSLVWTDQGYNGGPSGAITATFNFYFRVMLEDDKQDFEEFMNGLWTIGGQRSKNGSGQLKFGTARPPTS
jgi:hypothetical protein